MLGICPFTYAAFTLAFIYLLLFIFVCRYLINLVRQNSAKKRAQKIFLAVLIAQTLLRVLYFVLFPFNSKACNPEMKSHHDHGKLTSAEWFVHLLGNLPAMLFLSAFSVLVFTFARIYHKVLLAGVWFQERRFRILTGSLVIINALALVALLGDWAYSANSASGLYVFANIYIFGLMATCFVLAFAFLAYGALLYVQVQRIMRASGENAADTSVASPSSSAYQYGGYGGGYNPPDQTRTGLLTSTSGYIGPQSLRNGGSPMSAAAGGGGDGLHPQQQQGPFSYTAGGPGRTLSVGQPLYLSVANNQQPFGSIATDSASTGFTPARPYSRQPLSSSILAAASGQHSSPYSNLPGSSRRTHQHHRARDSVDMREDREVDIEGDEHDGLEGRNGRSTHHHRSGQDVDDDDDDGMSSVASSYEPEGTTPPMHSTDHPHLSTSPDASQRGTSQGQAYPIVPGLSSPNMPIRQPNPNPSQPPIGSPQTGPSLVGSVVAHSYVSAGSTSYGGAAPVHPIAHSVGYGSSISPEYSQMAANRRATAAGGVNVNGGRGSEVSMMSQTGAGDVPPDAVLGSPPVLSPAQVAAGQHTPHKNSSRAQTQQQAGTRPTTSGEGQTEGNTNGVGYESQGLTNATYAKLHSAKGAQTEGKRRQSNADHTYPLLSTGTGSPLGTSNSIVVPLLPNQSSTMSDQSSASAQSSSQHNPMKKIAVIAAICTICLILRLTLLIVMSALDMNFDWSTTLAYFALSEILPLTFLLQVFNTPTPLVHVLGSGNGQTFS